MAAKRSGDLPRVVRRDRGLERALQALAEAAGAEILHRDVRVIVGYAEVENAHDVGMVDARDDLVLLQEPIEQPPSADVGNVPQHLQRDSLAPLLRLRQVDRRQIAGVELRDQAALARAVQGLVVDEQLAGRVETLDAQLAAHDVDEALMLDAVLGEKIRRSGLQGIHGKELVAVRGEQQHRGAIVALAQETQEAEALVSRHGMSEQHEIDLGEIEGRGKRTSRARLMLVDDGVRPFDF